MLPFVLFANMTTITRHVPVTAPRAFHLPVKAKLWSLTHRTSSSEVVLDAMPIAFPLVAECLRGHAGSLLA